MITLNLSVHDVVDTILRTGHLDTRIFNRSSMEEGSRLHSLYQDAQSPDYISEYPVSDSFDIGRFRLNISGKADGVILKKDSLMVEEIKTTVGNLDEFIHDHGQWHLGQAIFYAYIICKEKSYPKAEIVMTYIKQGSFSTQKHPTTNFTFEELERNVYDVLNRFVLYLEKLQKFKDRRDESIPLLKFPFPYKRPGQDSMMDFIDDACEKNKKVYIEAPTGIGKTVSVLYPLCHRFGEKKADHVFYLTNKNSIKRVAMNTLALFDQSGVQLKSIEFTARDNICFNDKKGHCNPVECPFAKDYYTKRNEAVFDALNQYNVFDRKTIEQIGYTLSLCPFQFQWDLGVHCDVIVCDYNYVFDLNDQMELFDSHIQDTRSYLAIDECHNLPERVRDMYSLTLLVSEIGKVQHACYGTEFAVLRADILTLLKKINKIDPQEVASEFVSGERAIIKQIPDSLTLTINDILADFRNLMKKHLSLMDDTLLEFFYELNNLSELSLLNDEEKFKDCFLIYFMLDNSNSIIGIRIAALDSRPMIESGCQFFKSTVFFSATLTPKDYYIDLLGGESKEEESQLVLKSPFPKENRRVFVNTKYSLRYRDRNETLYDVYSQIRIACSQKKGNYFVFCPSFEYLKALEQYFLQDPLPDSEIFYQGASMNEQGREEFLSHFQSSNEKTTVGLLVIGGIFSEGIDLVGDRLIGCIIVSVGLPQVSFERNKIKEHFDQGDDSQKGFDYAYTYPGLNRILQAAGRVIRTETDRGFILFIDSRFRYQNYRKVILENYPDAVYLYSGSQLRASLKQFWKEEDDHEI